MNIDANSIINHLPDNIQKYIYFEYVKPDLILTELKNILNSKSSQNLDTKLLYNFLKKFILNDKQIIKYLLDNDKVFELIYKEHIINDIKRFKNFNDKYESFALCWLMYLYH